MEEKYDLIILGGGLTGLLAGHLSLQKGKKVLILEKEGNTGGFCRTLNWDDYRFDIGGHRIYFSNPENLKIIRKFAPLLETKIRKSVIYFQNDFLEYPPSFKSILKLHNIPLIKIVKDLTFKKPFKGKNNFETWVKQYYGDTLFNIYFKDYTEKVWGIPCDKLSSIWANQRIGATNLIQILTELIFKKTKIKENTLQFFYPANGIGTICDNIAKDIRQNGGTIINNVRNIKLSLQNKTISKITFNNGNDEKVQCNNVLSTIPLSEIPNILGENDNNIMKYQNELQFRNFIQVCFLVDNRAKTPYHWIYFPKKELKIARLFEPKNWSNSLCPNSKNLICTETICGVQDKIWHSDDETIINKMREELINVGIVKKDDIYAAKLYRFEDAYPVLSNSALNAKNALMNYLNQYKNLKIAGRSGTFSYYDMEECLQDAMRCIDNLFCGKSY